MKEIILGHWPIKLLSLIMAFLLWLYVISLEESFMVEEVVVPVVIKESFSHYKALPSPSQVKAKIKGERMDLLGLRRKEIRVNLIVEERKEGKYLYMLSPDMIKTPPNIEVIDVLPKEIEVTVSKRE
jgi:YbbR domain-containing protein